MFINKHLKVPSLLLVIFLVGCSVAGVANRNSNKSPVPTATEPEPSHSPSPTPPSPSTVLFIIDSSGSMKAKMGAKTKMDTAKDVVKQLIAGLPSETKAGLMAYGHRQKNDCKDVELLVPVGALQPPDFAQKIDTLEPLGQTPISFSIREAANVLKVFTGKKTIILISDGEETCKEDPCVVAADLKKADVDLKVHVVGFGIDKEAARKQLNCIAEATGGQYMDAKDAGELKKSLEGLAAEPEAPSGDKGRLIVDSLDSHGKRIFWCVEVYPEGQTGVPNRVFETCNSDKATENAFDMKPGRYDIWVYGAPVRSKPGKKTVEIIGGRDTQLPLDQTGRIFLNIVDQNGTAVQYVAQVKSLAEGISGAGTFYSGESHELMPGSYDIEIWGGPANVPKQTGVVIKPGEETRISITINR